MPDVILPVLDEVDALPLVLARLPVGYRPVVVDNGSGDGSAEMAENLGALVVREPKRGFGAACWTGLVTATSDIVCFMDCDGSLDPADLPAVVAPVLAGEAELVLGARRLVRGAMPAHARVANRYVARQLRRRAGLCVTDLGPMRAARRQSLIALGIADRRFGWPLEMVIRAAAAGWRVEEVPVGYRSRRGGRSKVSGSVTGTVRAALDMVRVLRGLTPPLAQERAAP